MVAWMGNYEGVGASMTRSAGKHTTYSAYKEGWNEGLGAELIIRYAGVNSVSIKGSIYAPIKSNSGIGFKELQNLQVHSPEVISGIFREGEAKAEYLFEKKNGRLTGYVKQYDAHFGTKPYQAVRFDSLTKVTFLDTPDFGQIR